MPTTYTPNEGRQLAGQLIFNQSNPDRGVGLALGLMTNTAGLGNGTLLTDIIEPSGGNYARISLADGGWTVNASGVCSYAKQIFTADGGAFNAAITGFFICTTGTAPRLLDIEVQDAAVTVGANETYSVTPIIHIAGG